MAVPIRVTNQDTGAPVLSGQDGAMYSVLKWALPQLGWSIAFDDPVAFSIAFQNAGTGNFFQVKDRASDTSVNDARYFDVSGFASMAAIDTGSGQHLTGGSHNMYKSYYDNATSIPYHIIGTSKSFYLFIQAEINQSNIVLQKSGHLFFVGDYVPLHLGHLTNWAILGHISENPPNTQYDSIGIPTLIYHPGAASDSTSNWDRTRHDEGIISGSANSPSHAKLCSMFEMPFSGTKRNIGTSTSLKISPFGGQVFSQVFIVEDSTSRILGTLPGLLNPQWAVANDDPFDPNVVSNVQTAYGNADCLSLPTMSSYGSQFVHGLNPSRTVSGRAFISLGEWGI